jgi:hypothetical protein
MMQEVVNSSGNSQAMRELSAMQTALGEQSAVSAYSNTQSVYDQAVAQAKSQLEAAIPSGSRIAFFNVSTGDTAIVNQMIDSVSQGIISAGSLSIIDRSNISNIMLEQNFQLSGVVSDDSVVSIGKIAGANAIILAAITGQGTLRQLSLRVLNVETAEVMTIITIKV